jgi:hypothetical protein
LATSPSPPRNSIVRDCIGTPFVSRVATSSIMAFMIFGTPAMTNTLPI